MEDEELKNSVKVHMDRYFKAKDQFSVLTEENKMLLGQVEQYIASIPDHVPIKKMINSEIDDYFASTKELGDTKNLDVADKLKQQPLKLALVKKEEVPYSSRAAFINIAILLYGVLNIGFILAVALMK